MCQLCFWLFYPIIWETTYSGFYLLLRSAFFLPSVWCVSINAVLLVVWDWFLFSWHCGLIEHPFRWFHFQALERNIKHHYSSVQLHPSLLSTVFEYHFDCLLQYLHYYFLKIFSNYFNYIDNMPVYPGIKFKTMQRSLIWPLLSLCPFPFCYHFGVCLSRSFSV